MFTVMVGFDWSGKSRNLRPYGSRYSVMPSTSYIFFAVPGILAPGSCGGTWGMVVGHIPPEAFEGGPIALVKEGDSITIDARKRLIQLNVSRAELARRKSKWKQPKPRYPTGVLGKYAKLVSDATHGAVTD